FLRELTGVLQGRTILLILDATQVASSWPLGVLQNDFARQVKELDEVRANPNLVVLLASDEGQRSWVSEEWRQSIFAHFVIEGLKGAAAQASGKSRVTALDLHHFVLDQVKKWTQVNRDQRQSPVLVGDPGLAERLELPAVEGAYREPSPE